jgi:TRAP-type C4-dicarboxylate transport system permease large subunit
MTNSRPTPENYRTATEYRWASKLWRAKHGGSMLGNVGVAILAGAITGSALALLAFVALAVVVTLARRN